MYRLGLIKWLITTAEGITEGAGAGDFMVFVRVSEVYDLKTRNGKMTMIGIHTPYKELIQKTYPGLLMNSKFVRIVSQDVALACASALPYSADIVGTGADMISPEDAFNPILYKAVSNESMSNIEARLLGTIHDSTVDGMQSTWTNDVTAMSDEFAVYYSLLANKDGFKVANPQAGLSMKNLVPLVFDRYYNVGVNSTSANEVNDVYPVAQTAGDPLADSVSSRSIVAMRGRAHPMPRFNTTYITSVGQTSSPGASMPNGMADGFPRNAQAQMPDIMPVYTACIIMPPSKGHALFFRMRVSTLLEFTEVRPISEVASFASLASDYAPIVYHSSYEEQSKMMDSKAGMVDAKDAEITKIMEGA